MNHAYALSRFSSSRLSLLCALFLTVIVSASGLQAQTGAQTQQRPRVQMPAGAATRVPAKAVAPQAVERAIQASAAMQRYHFKIEEQPALATLEGDVDGAPPKPPISRSASPDSESPRLRSGSGADRPMGSTLT